MIEITEDLLRRVLDGDQAAQEEARAMLPKVGNLFGRWATHPDYGRVLCVSHGPLQSGKVNVGIPDIVDPAGIPDFEWVPMSDLTFGPVELVTEEDFENAPEGTVIVPAHGEGGVSIKDPEDGWRDYSSYQASSDLVESGPWQVVRWGKGEQA